LTQEKRLAQVNGHCAFAEAALTGYEIHMGISHGAALSSPVFYIDGRPEGALSVDDQIMGTYLHGLFDSSQASAALLRWAGLKSDAVTDLIQLREQSLDRVADASVPLFEKLLSIRSN
jgi:adenosylcobyric acid synthase